MFSSRSVSNILSFFSEVKSTISVDSSRLTGVGCAHRQVLLAPDQISPKQTAQL